MKPLPRLHWIATGGTIAGTASTATELSDYRAATLSPDTLLAALPEAAALATLTASQPFALDSKDITPAHWLELAQALRQHDAADACDGFVLTHGTDTLEETAFFLALTQPRTRPIVLTAAMRPATAHSADGPMNLFQALVAATQPEAAAHGPLILANDRLWAARDATKRHTWAVDALGGWDATPVGMVRGTQVEWRVKAQASQPSFGGPLPATLPRVDILAGYAGAPASLIDASITDGARGLVLALAGHGSVPNDWLPALERARAQGVAVVRASRIATGGVLPGAGFDDTGAGTLACGRLTPWQARIALMLGLARHMTPEALQTHLCLV